MLLRAKVCYIAFNNENNQFVHRDYYRVHSSTVMSTDSGKELDDDFPYDLQDP